VVGLVCPVGVSCQLVACLRNPKSLGYSSSDANWPSRGSSGLGLALKGFLRSWIGMFDHPGPPLAGCRAKECAIVLVVASEGHESVTQACC
jgi:hypothetical protein